MKIENGKLKISQGSGDIVGTGHELSAGTARVEWLGKGEKERYRAGQGSGDIVGIGHELSAATRRLIFL